MNDYNEMRALAVMDRPTNNSENPPEIDYISDGNFLELADLDHPSSCTTMSSDEYFDSDALLRDLEPENHNGLDPENAGYKYSFSAFHRPDELVMSPGSLVNVESSKHKTEEILKTKCSMPGSSMMNRELDSKALKETIHDLKADYGDEGPSSNVHNSTLSSRGHIELENGEKKSAIGPLKKLKRKYSCFMPF